MQNLVFKYSKPYKISKTFIEKKGGKKLVRELDVVWFIFCIK